MPLKIAERVALIGPTRRMPEYETPAARALWWAVPNSPVPKPPDAAWPVVPWDHQRDQPFPAQISTRGPVVVSDFLSGGLGNRDLTDGLDRLEKALKRKARDREAFTGVTVLPGDLDWTYANLDTALTAAGSRGAGEARSQEQEVIHHLLRDTLLGELAARGFDLTIGLVAPLGLLSNDAFYSPMTQRQHMKDVLVGQDHGEWTHLLQWYLLATTSALNHGDDAAQVFEYLGYQGMAQAQRPPGPGWGPNLWRLCCDRDAPYIHTNTSPAKDTDDFRNPDMLHLSLAGYAPELQKDRQAKMAQIGGNPLAAFTTVRDAWITNRRRWPFVCVLLRRRVLKREPLYQRLERMTEDLKAEMRPRIKQLFPAVGAEPTSKIDQFFLNQLLATPAAPPINWNHLDFAPGRVLSAAGEKYLYERVVQITNDYRAFFGQAKAGAIPYLWSRRHRADPTVPAPPQRSGAGTDRVPGPPNPAARRTVPASGRPIPVATPRG